MLTEGPNDVILHRPDGEGGPLYRLRVPRGFDGPRFKTAVEVHGGRCWSWLQTAAELEAAIRRLLPEDDAERQRLLFHVAEWSDRIHDALRRLRAGEFQDNEGNVTAELAMAAAMPAECLVVERLAHDHDPLFRRLEADNNAYSWIAGIVATQMFCRAWEGPELPPYRRGLDGVPLDLIDELPKEHVISIGIEIGNRIDLPRLLRKNSGSPLGGGVEATTSSTSPMPAPNGHSPTSSGTIQESA